MKKLSISSGKRSRGYPFMIYCDLGESFRSNWLLLVFISATAFKSMFDSILSTRDGIGVFVWLLSSFSRDKGIYVVDVADI